MNIKSNISVWLQSVVCGAAFILLSIPAFNMTGSIFMPLLICFTGSVLICFCAVIFRFSVRIIGNSLLILMLFWLVFALLKETILQIEAGFVFDWIDFFYFDKLLMLGAIWLTASLFFALKRLVSKETNEPEYTVFFKTASIAFLVFYVFLLIYSFILIRLKTGSYPFRFQPFVTIREYLYDFNTIPYEVFMMFFGNLFYFTPLGFIVSRAVCTKRKSVRTVVNLLFPIIAFTLLEFSQFIFQNGYCEFDDMMMNTLGFWLGNLMFIVLNKAAVFLSKGKYSTFWY